MRRCDIEGCEKEHHSKGYCKGHYLRLYKYGDPLGFKPKKRNVVDVLKNEHKVDPKEFLYEHYIELDWTFKMIGEKIAFSENAVKETANRLGIKTKPKWHYRRGKMDKDLLKKMEIARVKILKGKKLPLEQRQKISKTLKGIKRKEERVKIKNHYGYILVYVPNNPNANKSGYIPEHRLVMEQKIGRSLKKGETVHHINGIRDDNRPENLHLFATPSEHNRYHAWERKSGNIELKYRYTVYDKRKYNTWNVGC